MNQSADKHCPPACTAAAPFPRSVTAPAASRGAARLALAGALALLLAAAAALVWQHRELQAAREAAGPNAATETTTDAAGANAGADAEVEADAATADAQALASRLDRLEARLEADLADVERRGETRAETLAEAFDGAQRRLEEAAEAHRREVEALRAQLQPWRGRVRELEESLAALTGVPEDVRERWLRAEAEYLLGAAAAQLELGADVDGARAALEQAEARLRAIGDTQLAPVLEALQGERDALAGVPAVDRTELGIRLGELAAAIESLPLPTLDVPAYALVEPEDGDSAAGSAASAEETPAEAADEPGVARAWRLVRNALGDLVRVHRDEGPLGPRLPPEQAYFLRRNLELQIEGARLALLQRRGALYRDQLEAAARWLERWFDLDEPETARVHEALVELAAQEIDPALPQLGAARERLRGQAGDGGEGAGP